MTKNRGLLLSSVATAGFLAFSCGALAADMPPPPESTWTGFHIGVGGGYGAVLHEGFTFLEGSVEDKDFEGDVDFFIDNNFDDLGDDGGLLTVEGGFDLQVAERFVVGIQGDYTWTNFDSDTDAGTCVEVDPSDGEDISFCANYGLNVQIDDMWTIAARFGFLSSPETLWYGLVGWTHADVDATDTISLRDDIDPEDEGVEFLGDSAENGDNLDGITVGAGVETLLTDNISLKLEYRYTDLGGLGSFGDFAFEGEDFSVSNDEDEAGFEYDFDTRIQSIRAVLSYRFNWL